MDKPAQVYVALLGEGTEVWRPVEAIALGGEEFELLGDMPDDEVWQFSPGTRVRCKKKVFADGGVALAAYEAVVP